MRDTEIAVLNAHLHDPPPALSTVRSDLPRALDEVLALSDRILVMHDGRIVGEVTQAEATERTLGLMMAGVAPAHSST